MFFVVGLFWLRRCCVMKYRDIIMVRKIQGMQWVMVIALFVLFILQGCSTIQRFIAPRPDPQLAIIRTEVINFAEVFFDKIADMTYKVSGLAGTPQARVDTALWRIHYCTSAIQIATGPNPKANLIDMVTMVSLGRMAMEDDAVEHVLGAHTQILQNTFRRLEQQGWEIARRYLTREQLSELRKYIYACHERYPKSILVGNVRLAEYTNIRAKSGVGKQTNMGSELIGILVFDPFSSLDPAIREVEALRDFADRSMFQMERFPIIMRWQMEMLYNRILQEPESQGLFEDISRFSASTERFSQTVAILPDRITEERKDLFRSLEGELSKMNGLLGQLEHTATHVRKEADALAVKLFRSCALLIALFFVGLVISLVAYRLITHRIISAPRQ